MNGSSGSLVIGLRGICTKQSRTNPPQSAISAAWPVQTRHTVSPADHNVLDLPDQRIRTAKSTTDKSCAYGREVSTI